MGGLLLELEWQMFQQWHHWREVQISRQDLKIVMQPIHQAIEATLKAVSNLVFAKREKTPSACTVRTGQGT